VTQVCGAPLVAHHLDDLSVVGAFDLDLPEGVSPGRYHSVLISRHDRSLDRLVDDQVCVAINSDDSLTGRLSLLDATVGVDRAWPGDVTLSGSHLQSMRALASGDADLASIDPWSLAFIAAEEPDLLAGLHRVGNGPTVPSPPIAARATLDRAQLAEIRDGFIAALDDPVTAVARQALHIRGFVALTVDDYLPLRDLLPG
jgi:ABC-type phosphate/phosphonate transport system substrate-binding protein